MVLCEILAETPLVLRTRGICRGLAFTYRDPFLGASCCLPFLSGLCLMLLVFGSLQYLATEGERRTWFDDGSIATAAALLLTAAHNLWEFAVGVKEQLGRRSRHRLGA